MDGNEVLRDKYGNRLGEVVTRGSKSTVRDLYGTLLGSYDTHDNWTRDRYGNFRRQGEFARHLLKWSVGNETLTDNVTA